MVEVGDEHAQRYAPYPQDDLPEARCGRRSVGRPGPGSCVDSLVMRWFAAARTRNAESTATPNSRSPMR